jgi:hypothetical protein
MFVKTFRLRRRVAFLLAALFAGGVGLWSAQMLHLPTAVPVAATTATDNAGRMAYLASVGWEVEEEPWEILEIVIPQEFDSVYEQYNQLQIRQGFDLTRWHGKTARRYTYRILNYPNPPGTVYANLIVCDQQIIAGDVSCVALNGFMHGLVYESH